MGAWIETLLRRCHRLQPHVAPLVGAWIETTKLYRNAKLFGSHPSWVRGLKLKNLAQKDKEERVAPLVGAWIETSIRDDIFELKTVAPLVGAWIETQYALHFQLSVSSHPSWVRGLKLIFDIFFCNIDVAPLVGAWIETLRSAIALQKYKSHPSWVRGLKLSVLVHLLPLLQSHPSWVRGLKLLQTLNTMTTRQSHPSWVRGLKLVCFYSSIPSPGRTPRGCVD